MPCARMILVKVLVRTPQLAMVGTVLRTIIETLVVRPLVGSINIPVNLSVLRMIASMLAVVVVTFVGRGRRGSSE